MQLKILIVNITMVLLVLAGCDSGTGKKYFNWPELGIELNSTGIEKSQIADCCFRGYIRNIQTGNFDNDPELEIAVVPQTGIFLFDASTLKKKSKIEYKKPDGKTLWFGLSPFIIQNKNNFNIAKRGGGYGEVALLDKAGKKLWSFSSSNGDMVVDNSIIGKPSFYVSNNNHVYKLGPNGKVIWKISEDASHITLINDTSRDEAGFATADHSSRTLNIWTSEGKLRKKIELPLKPDGLAFVHSGTTSGFVIKSGRKISFIDRSGKHRFTYSYSNVPIYHGPSAALVRFTAHEPPVLAILSTSRSSIGKSVLSIFSLDGTHLYEEYLDGGPALAVVPVNDEGRDRLFVGDGTSRLWVYEQSSPNSLVKKHEGS